MASYVDLSTIHDPSTGAVAPATWGDQIRENFEFFVAPPSARGYYSSTQSVSHATPTFLTTNTESWDTHGALSSGIFTAPVTGKYLLNAVVEWQQDSTGMRGVEFVVNGSQVVRVFYAQGGSTAVQARGSGSMIYSLSAGHYVQVRTYQNSGSSLNTQLNEFSAVWVGG